MVWVLYIQNIISQVVMYRILNKNTCSGAKFSSMLLLPHEVHSYFYAVNTIFYWKCFLIICSGTASREMLK